MEALGHNTTSLRLVAWAIAGFIASIAGILNVWYTGQVSPGATDVNAASNLLIVAVIGGIRRPSGAFVGALFFVLLETFAMELVDRDRFNLVIGLTFIFVVMFLADGLTGLPAVARKWFRRGAGRIEAIHTTIN
jgi:branched-chain amino acid transport system permease protein